MQKYDFFLSQYEATNTTRLRYKANFLNLAKISPVFFGVLYFLATQRSADVLSDNPWLGNFYDMTIFVSLALLLFFSALVALGYLRPPEYRYLASPGDLALHWQELERYSQKHGSENIQAISFQDSILKSLVNCAEHNDKKNAKQNRLFNFTGIILLLVLVTYVVLLIVLAGALYV